MPEIAEVRTVAKTLNNKIVGLKITEILTPYDKIIEGNKSEFLSQLIGKTFTCVDNYGKWLFLVLGDITIMSHLRMEGKYFIKNSTDEILKHEHIIFRLDNGMDLRYHDTRKFGKMLLVNTNDIYKTNEITKLGIEPDNKSLTAEYIYSMIHNKEMPIKTLLLDQSIINGLGNIYADEVLFASGIHPLTSGKNITLEECEKIKNSAKTIITNATLSGGTTIRSYTSSLGVYGHYQDKLCVHTKEGKPCPICKTIIKKIRVNGRGTYYCENCQKQK